MLQMFGGDYAELMQSLTPMKMLTCSSQPIEGVMTSGLAMFGANQSHMQVGTQTFTPYGALKAELMANGMLQTSLEQFTLLGGALMFNTQLAWSGMQLAGGVVQGIMGIPLGMVMGSANTGGQTSAEMIMAVPLNEAGNSGLMLGVHSWQLLGQRCGLKGALEWKYEEMDGEQSLSQTNVALACTRPSVQADGSPLAEPELTTSLSVAHKTAAKHSLLAALDWAPQKEGVMTLGGTRQLTDATRLRGKWNTTGVLALALEVAGDKSSLSFTTEWDTTRGEPNFGVTINLSP